MNFADHTCERGTPVREIVTESSHDGRAISSTENAIAGSIKGLWNSVKFSDGSSNGANP
jgi:hypothetical protein